MAQQSGLKGNPASKRMGNPRRKERRQESFRRGETRKADRIAKQKMRAHHNNVEQVTKWEGAKEDRKWARREKVEQKRNEFGHILKRIDEHDVVICDHPKGYVHAKVKAE